MFSVRTCACEKDISVEKVTDSSRQLQLTPVLTTLMVKVDVRTQFSMTNQLIVYIENQLKLTTELLTVYIIPNKLIKALRAMQCIQRIFGEFECFRSYQCALCFDTKIQVIWLAQYNDYRFIIVINR